MLRCAGNRPKTGLPAEVHAGAKIPRESGLPEPTSMILSGLRIFRDVFVNRVLTVTAAPAYIPPHGAAAASVRWRASEALHRYSVTSLRSQVGGLGFDRPSRPLEGGIILIPGCLTGESEERETWTAGSLRTASHRRSNLFAGAVVGRDFGGRRF
jgi:hypothetical protein